MDWQTVITDDYRAAVRAIKAQMPAWLRAAYDAEDFVADAVLAVLSHPNLTYRGRQTLILIASRRMIDAVRRPKTVQHDESLFERPSTAPSAEQIAEAAELRDQVLSQAEIPEERTCLELLCLGHTPSEIAERTGYGKRTLQRYFKRFKRHSGTVV